MGWCIYSMSNPYIGIDNSARLVKQIDIGQNGVARKVLNGYIGVDGVARLFYRSTIPFSYTYTGNVIETEKTIDGVEYVVLTITSSGRFTVSRPINVDVWMCGGGGNGSPSKTGSYSGGGGSGAEVYETSYLVNDGYDWSITVGAATGSTYSFIFNASGGGTASGAVGAFGGSGGGGGGAPGGWGEVNGANGGRGDGETKIPSAFGISNIHCGGGGGGGGSHSSSSGNTVRGGNGGSNGGDGKRSSRTSNNGRGGSGSDGGGSGGNAAKGGMSVSAGGNARYYGSGGGGGGGGGSEQDQSGGRGYQGVVYIRWKKEDAE